MADRDETKAQENKSRESAKTEDGSTAIRMTRNSDGDDIDDVQITIPGQ